MENITSPDETSQMNHCLGIQSLGYCEPFYHKEYSFFDLSGALTALALFVTITLNVSKTNELRRTARRKFWGQAFRLVSAGVISVFIGRLLPFIWTYQNSGIQDANFYELRISWEILGSIFFGIGIITGTHALLGNLSLKKMWPLNDLPSDIKLAIIEESTIEGKNAIIREMYNLLPESLNVTPESKNYAGIVDIYECLKENDLMEIAVNDAEFTKRIVIYYFNTLSESNRNNNDPLTDSGYFYEFVIKSIHLEGSQLKRLLCLHDGNPYKHYEKIRRGKGNYMKEGIWTSLLRIFSINEKCTLSHLWEHSIGIKEIDSVFISNYLTLWRAVTTNAVVGTKPIKEHYPPRWKESFKYLAESINKTSNICLAVAELACVMFSAQHLIQKNILSNNGNNERFIEDFQELGTLLIDSLEKKLECHSLTQVEKKQILGSLDSVTEGLSDFHKDNKIDANSGSMPKLFALIESINNS